MKAVTRCLTVSAALLLVGACGGDPTAEDAGADLHIRATPGAVWVAEGATATITVEAVDAVGGTVGGTWRVTDSTPGITTKFDTAYQSTNTGGPVGYKARFIVSGAAQDGSITISGTGGSLDVPVRVAPDTNSFAATFSNTTPAIAEIVTATAPAGFRFTGATTVGFTGSNGLAAPSVTGFSADSTQVSFLPAPGATGQVRFTNFVFLTAPGQKNTARSTTTVAAPPLSTVPVTFSNAAPAVNTPVTVTLGANFKFRPTSTFTALARTGIVQSIATDSLSASIIPVPGNNGPVTISALQFLPLPSLSVSLPTSVSLNVPAAPDLGTDDPTVPGFGTFTATLNVGQSTGFFDQATLGTSGQIPAGQGFGFPEQWVQLTVTNSGTYTVSLDWLGTSTDFDLYVTDAGRTTNLLQAASLARPESASVVLAAGTYWIALVDFETGAQWVKVTLRRTA